MENFISRSDRVSLMCGDFSRTFAEITAADAVYCDPPYVPLNPTSSFTAYAKGGFSWDDQLRLLKHIESAAAHCRGIVLSNHDTPQTRLLYQNADLQTPDVQRNIAAHGESRKKIAELPALWHNAYLTPMPAARAA